MFSERPVGLAIAATLLLSCGEAAGVPPSETATSPGAATAPGEATGAPHALPAQVTADVVLPGTLPDRHMLATIDLGSGLPWAITGCIGPGAAPCEETSRVELDEAARTELVRVIEEVRAIPRCEPEGIFPDDRPYTLTLTGFARPYVGNLPGDVSALAARNAGPCRADARLAWWILARFDPRAAGASAAGATPEPSTAPPLPDLPES